MFNREIFSERLKTMRNSKNITIIDIANALEIKKQSVSTWENMKTIPSSEKLVLLAEIFDVSIDYLVGRTDNPDVNK